MTELRETTPDERRALSLSVRRAAKLGGGAASVQHMTRVGEADLSRYGTPEIDDRHCPIDVALDLDRMAGSPVIAAELARLQGYRLVAADARRDGGVSMEDAARIVTEAADVVRAIAEGGADGSFDTADRNRVNREIEEAVAALRCVQGRVNGLAG